MRAAPGMRYALPALLLAVCTAQASQTEKAEITFSGGTYSYTFIAVVQGGAEAVHAVVADYEHLQRLNDDIVESRVLERYGPGELKRVLRLEKCILMICFDIAFVERVSEAPNRIITTIVPDEGTFSEGTAAWLIEPVDASHTRITVNAIQTPEFWIPPILGPMVLKRVFLKEVAETCANIERIVLGLPPLNTDD